MADTTPGAISGLVKSKKYGLTFAFATTCFALLTQTSNLTLQIALIGSAALAVCTYVISQAVLESKPGEAPPEDESQNSAIPTNTIGSIVPPVVKPN